MARLTPEGKDTRATLYTTGVITHTSGQAKKTTIKVREGFHFVCRAITWRKTGAFTFNIFAQRDFIFNDEIDVRALTQGDAQGWPVPLYDGYVFPEGTEIRFDTTDKYNDTNQVEMVLHGEEWDAAQDGSPPK